MQDSKSKEPKKSTTVKSLKIGNKSHKPLSKSQLQFNKLTKQIETIEKSIEVDTAKSENLLKYYSTELYPLENKTAEAQLDLSMVLGNSIEKYKYTKKQKNKIVASIIDLCDKSFRVIEPSPQQEAFYNQWSETTYKEELELQENESKEEFLHMMKFMFGVDIDPDLLNDLDGEKEEKFHKLLDEVHKQIEPKANSKKTAKQLKREEQQKAEEAIKNRGIRSIYIALAKILHPDTETDPILKLEKEELMKKVTVAFDKKDLTTLLKLELEWVHQQTEHLENLTEEKLKIYISALKQQVSELEIKRQSIYYNPRFSPISHLFHMQEKYAKIEIKNDAKQHKITLETLLFFASSFKLPNQKKEILEFTDEYNNLIEDEEDDLFDF